MKIDAIMMRPPRLNMGLNLVIEFSLGLYVMPTDQRGGLVVEKQ